MHLTSVKMQAQSVMLPFFAVGTAAMCQLNLPPTFKSLVMFL